MDSTVNQLSPKSNQWLNALNCGHKCDQTLGLKCNPLLIIKKLSEEQIQRYDKYFYEKYVVNSSQIEEPVESDINSIEIPEFMRNLNLISKQELAEKSMNSLKKSFPLRIVDRIGVSVVNRESIERANRLSPQSMAAKSVTKKYRKRRQTLGQRLTPKPQPKSAFTHKKANETKKRRIMKLLSAFAVTSKLSHNLVQTLGVGGHSSREDTKWTVNRYPKNDVLLSYSSTNRYNEWSPKNIELKAKDWEFGQQLSREDMDYVFTRRQRLEQQLRRKTGLNWRSRLTTLSCRPFDVSLQKLEEKPLNQLFSDSMDRQWNSQDSDRRLFAIDFDDFCLNEILNKSMLSSAVTVDDSEVVEESNDKSKEEVIVVIKRDPKIDAMAKEWQK